jgi:hypothetical protein
MPLDTTKIFAQSAVRLFGWAVGKIPAEMLYPNPEEKKDGKGEPLKGYKPGKDLPERYKFFKGPLLESVAATEELWLANVQAFSHEGRYTPFRAPALFLVHWEGDPIWEKEKAEVDPARLGLASLDNAMVFAPDLKFWTYDRSAYITRLDMSAGTLQRVVIDLETSGAQGRRIDLVGQEGSFMARLGQGNH